MSFFQKIYRAKEAPEPIFSPVWLVSVVREMLYMAFFRISLLIYFARKEGDAKDNHAGPFQMPENCRLLVR